MTSEENSWRRVAAGAGQLHVLKLSGNARRSESVWSGLLFECVEFENVSRNYDEVCSTTTRPFQRSVG